MPDKGNEDRKTAVITGFSGGIGKAIAEEFAKAGYCIVINSIDEQEIKHAANDISKIIGEDNRVAYTAGDISQQHIAKSLIEQAIQRFGSVDVLINNAKKVDELKKIVNEENFSSYVNGQQQKAYFTLEEYETPDPKLKGAYLCIKEAVK